MYEEEVGKKNYIINSYFLSDYISRYMLGSFFTYSFCFIIVMAVKVMFMFDAITNEPDIRVIMSMFRPFIYYYIMGLVAYEAIVLIVYAIRYSKGKRQIRENTVRLKKLQRIQNA